MSQDLEVSRAASSNTKAALERDFALITGFDDPDAKIVSQPMTIRFEDAGRQRRYTPDFGVTWSDGLFELVEVKYRADLRENWSSLRPGFAAARDVARETGGRFRIATERAIRGVRLENARRLLPLRRTVIDPDAAVRAVQAAKSAAIPTFGSIVAAISSDRVFALGVVWRLIAQGVLKVDVDTPIGLDTPVRLS
jgi:hypothetical protein